MASQREVDLLVPLPPRCRTTGSGDLQPTKGLQKSISKLIAKKAVKRFRRTLVSTGAQQHFAALGGKNSARFLTVAPTEPALQLSDDHARIAFRTRLNAPPASRLPSACACGARLTADDPGHLLRCTKQPGGHAIKRHDDVNRALITSIKRANLFVQAEPNGLCSDARLRPDLLCLLGSTTYIGDVTIVTPKPPKDDVSALVQTEQRKVAKYSGKLDRAQQDAVFTPLAFDTNGGFGPSAERFISLIADECEGDSRFDFHQNLINRIAVAIQRGNATIVLEGLKTAARVSAARRQ